MHILRKKKKTLICVAAQIALKNDEYSSNFHNFVWACGCNVFRSNQLDQSIEENMLDDFENLVRSRRMFGMEFMNIHGGVLGEKRRRGVWVVYCRKIESKFMIFWQDSGQVLKNRWNVGEEGFRDIERKVRNQCLTAKVDRWNPCFDKETLNTC